MALRAIEEELDEIAKNYHFPRATDLASPRLDFQQVSLGESLSTSHFPRDDGLKGQSKAVAGAMRALQDKIKHLEALNFRLKSDLEQAELRSRSTRDHLVTRSEEAKSTETALRSHIQQLEEALFRERNARNETQMDLTEQISQQEQLLQETEGLKRQLEQKNKEIMLFERNLDAIEKERTRFLTENSDLKAKIARQNAEIDIFRSGSDSNRFDFVSKMTENEDNLRKQLTESQAKVIDLEQSVSNLKALLAQNSQKLPSPKKTTGKKHKKVTNSGKIAQLEREISELNSNYKDYLEQSDSLDLAMLRARLNGISEQIEGKTKELVRLKQGNR